MEAPVYCIRHSEAFQNSNRVPLSGEKYPTVAAVGPLLSKIKRSVAECNDDNDAVKAFKKILEDDPDNCYTRPAMKALLNKSSFLNPCFKALTHLSQMQQDELSCRQHYRGGY